MGGTALESRLRLDNNTQCHGGGANFTFCFTFSLVENKQLNRKVWRSETGLHAFRDKFKHIQSHTHRHTDMHPAVRLKDFPCLSAGGTLRVFLTSPVCVVCVCTWLVGHARWQQVAVLWGSSQRTLVMGKHGNHQGGHVTLNLEEGGCKGGRERKM